MSVISPVITLNCAHYRKSRTLAAVAHIYEEKWKRYLLRPFFLFFFCEGFAILYVLLFSTKKIISTSLYAKRGFSGALLFNALCNYVLQFYVVPIFVKVAHIFSRFCLLDTGNINLHQSTAEKWFSTNGEKLQKEVILLLPDQKTNFPSNTYNVTRFILVTWKLQKEKKVKPSSVFCS